MKCPYCYNEYDPIKRQAIVYKSKVANARNSYKKARANGTPFGRPKIRNDEQIKELRSKGLSLRKIAKETGLSATAIHKALRALNLAKTF